MVGVQQTMEIDSCKVRCLQSSLKRKDSSIDEALTDIDTMLDAVNRRIDQLVERHDICIKTPRHGTCDLHPDLSHPTQSYVHADELPDDGSEGALVFTLQNHISRRQSVLSRAYVLKETLCSSLDKLFQLVEDEQTVTANATVALSTVSCSCPSQDASLSSTDCEENALVASMADCIPVRDQIAKEASYTGENAFQTLNLVSRVENYMLHSSAASFEDDASERCLHSSSCEEMPEDSQLLSLPKVIAQTGCSANTTHQDYHNQSSSFVGNENVLVASMEKVQENSSRTVSSGTQQHQAANPSVGTENMKNENLECNDGVRTSTPFASPSTESTDTICEKLCNSATPSSHLLETRTPVCGDKIHRMYQKDGGNQDASNRRSNRQGICGSNSTTWIDKQDLPVSGPIRNPVSHKEVIQATDTQSPLSNCVDASMQSNTKGACKYLEDLGCANGSRNEQPKGSLNDQPDVLSKTLVNVSTDNMLVDLNANKEAPLRDYSTENSVPPCQLQSKGPQQTNCEEAHACCFPDETYVSAHHTKCSAPNDAGMENSESDSRVELAGEDRYQTSLLEDIPTEGGGLLTWIQREMNDFNRESDCPVGNNLSGIDSADCGSVGGSSTSSLSYTSSQINGLSQLHERVMDVLPVLSSRGFKFSFKEARVVSEKLIKRQVKRVKNRFKMRSNAKTTKGVKECIRIRCQSPERSYVEPSIPEFTPKALLTPAHSLEITTAEAQPGAPISAPCNLLTSTTNLPPPKRVEKLKPEYRQVNNNINSDISGCDQQPIQSECFDFGPVTNLEENAAFDSGKPCVRFPRDLATHDSITAGTTSHRDGAGITAILDRIPCIQGTCNEPPLQSLDILSNPLSSSLWKLTKHPVREPIENATNFAHIYKRREDKYRLKKALQKLQSTADASESCKKPNPRKPSHHLRKDRNSINSGEATLDGRPISFWVLPIKDRT